MNGNTENIVAYIVILFLVALCAGTPDLLDAIISWVGRQP